MDPIAIVGIACRFPGGATDPRSFWDLLRHGVDAISEVPADRWNASRFHHPDASAPGRIVSRWGGFVSNPESFDASFFGIAPREAARMDPQQRWLAEVAWEAIEDAGLPPERLAGTRTGVFVGISHSDYPTLMNDRLAIDRYVNSGSALSIAANRLSFMFDFRGPSMAVDTACSSSLVALHLAARSLRSGDCTAAVVGGANALLTPEASIGFSQARMLSPRGRCRTFDADADGYVRSEGAAAVLLMPLDRARELHLHPRALLVATASNQDGRSSSLTVPNQKAQEEMILAALQEADLDPGAIVYVEAHGTGTIVGDRIEVRALARTLAKSRPPGRPLLLGSVKSNIGHLEPASGLAGLIKSVLVLEHRAIPPNLHFEHPSPRLPLESMKVPTLLTPLPSGHSGVPFVGVNSFGFGGTNAHAVLAPAPSSVRHQEPAEEDPLLGGPQILPLSARSAEALAAYAHAAAEMIERDATLSLEELCAAFALGKSQHAVRTALVADSLPSLLSELRSSGSGGAPAAASSPPKIAFIFSGQGAHWWAMGRQTYRQEKVVREIWEQCDGISRSLGGPAILEELLASEETSRLDYTGIAQPALFTLQAGLVELWRSRGIHPQVVIGHSVGEAAAAWAAGVFDLETALRLVILRSQWQETTRGKGSMLAAGISHAEALSLEQRYQGRVSVAAFNAPGQVTLSGSETDLNEVSARLTGMGAFCRFLPVHYAFHSPLMDPIGEGLRQALASIEGRPATIPLISTVTGRLASGPELTADYWWRNVRNPVRFASAVERALDDGCTAFVEIGPHPVLASSLAEISLRSNASVSCVASLRRGDDERATLLTSLATLYRRGSEVNWEAIYRRPERAVRLPAYPWQRQRFWPDSSSVAREVHLPASHPLLGDLQGDPLPTWVGHLDARLIPWLSDHRVAGTVVIPAAAYLEMAAAAVRQFLGQSQILLENIRFHRLLFIPDEHVVRVCTRLDLNTSSFQILSASPDDPPSWEIHAEGQFRRGRLHEPAAVDLADLRLQFDRTRSSDDVYEELEAMGQTYGKAFRGVTSLLLQGNERALGSVTDPVQRESADYELFPPSLDSCFHPAVALKDEHGRPDRAVVVVSLNQLRIFRPLPEIVWSHVRIVQRWETSHLGDFTIYDSSGNVVAQAQGLRVREIDPETRASKHERSLYRLEWESAGNLQDSQDDTGEVLIFCDREGFGERVAARLRTRGVAVTEVFAGPRSRIGGLRVDPSRADWADRLVGQLSARGPIPVRIIYLWSWSSDPPEDTPSTDGGCGRLLDLIRALSFSAEDTRARWLIATRNGQAVNPADIVAPQWGSVWGFTRTVQTEKPHWQISLIDCLDDSVESLIRELYAQSIEPEVAFRSECRSVRRLRRISAENEDPRSGTDHGRPPAYTLRLGQPGRVDSLSFAGKTRPAPRGGEVEVEIAAAGLNFRDLMKVLGIYPRADDETVLLGDEFSGTVMSCGTGARGLQPGDRVMGFAPAGGAFGSHVVVPREVIWKIPRDLEFGEASSIPVAFGTAYHALHTLARLRSGETILIHAAAGGVGLAAVQLARKIGARIFATAGSDAKRTYLRSLGVEWVMDSRSLDFADETLHLTGGRGVDVVLNSLAGAFQQKSIDVCASQGRFVEVGKRDLYQNGMLPLSAFQRSLSFFAFDLGSVLANPGRGRSALRRFFNGGFLQRDLRPLPTTTFSAQEAPAAFRLMQEAEHIGKIVIDFSAGQRPQIPAEFWPDPDGTYLVTGGPSGFGLAAAAWLAGRGAKHLVLVNRRGEGSPADSTTVESLRAGGVSVSVMAADIADPAALANVLSFIDQTCAPLRGVLHGAMVLRDRGLDSMTHEDLTEVLRPKVAGAWNLHLQTASRPLDCFLMFSSIAAILGSHGQANYAAANAFLDALAHHRRSLDLPALSVNWGPIADTGVAAARPELGQYLKNIGITALEANDALAPMAGLIARSEPQVCFVDADWQQLGRAGSKFATSPIFRELAEEFDAAIPADSPDRWRRFVLALPASQQIEAVSELIVAQLASTLGMPAAEIDHNGPLHGMDSLMAVELKFRIENHTGCDLPIDVFNGNLTLPQLSERLLAQMVKVAPGAESDVHTFPGEAITGEISAPFLRREAAPLFELMKSGELDELKAAALMSWPDELFERAGIAPQDFFARLNGGRVSFDLIIETPLGSVGIFMLPLTTSRIRPGERALMPHLIEAVRQATGAGAECVALTGLIPSATGYGMAVREACESENGLAAITTGHGTTIAAVILNLESLLEEADRDLEDESVLIYGVGSIGLGALRLMLEVLPHPGEILLCDPYRDRRFFDDLAQALRSHHRYRGAIRVVESSEAGPASEFYDGSVIVGATNAANLLDVERLSAGTLIVDDSAPHCLNGPAALRRFMETQDILCTEGGFVRASVPMPRIAHVPPTVASDLPAELPQLLFAMLNPQDITACVLSALLSASRSDLPPTLGLVDPAMARRHWDALRELNFAAAGLNYEGTPLPRELVENFRDRFGKTSGPMTATSRT